MHIRLLATAVAASLAYATPALAYEPVADMGYAAELQQWSVAGPSGTVSFTALMHTVVLTDRTGMVMALISSVSQTEGARQSAERDAAANDKAFYSYQTHISEPTEGLHLGLTLGTGSPMGLTAPGVVSPMDTDAKLARLRMDTDLFEVLAGTLGLNFGLAYFQATAAAPTGSAFKLTSINVPLGLSWRISPLPVAGLVFEPYADSDLAQAFARRLGFEAGLRAAYYMHPRVALTGRVGVARWGVSGTPTLPDDALADVRTASLGATLLF